MQDELRSRRVCIEVLKGVMTEVLLHSDVEETLASVTRSTVPGA